MTTLEEHIRWLAATPVLLVACDFDGTLAPIAPHPAEVRAERRSVEALRELASLGHTHAAVISGRASFDLSEYFKDPADLLLVGSHGAENPLAAESSALPKDTVELLARLRAEISRATDGVAGAWAETKPLGVAVHYRQADPAEAADLTGRLQSIAAELEGVRLLRGKKVVEFVIGGGDKGRALLNLRHRTGATAALFIGDDVTDEDAFEVLTRHDLGVKVGTGDTRAGQRVADTAAVADALQQLLTLRRQWLASRRLSPIDRHWLLSDQRACALVDPVGRLVWACIPRLDSPPLFAELLGGPARGFWEIVAADCPNQPEQRWLEKSFVVQTCWPSCTPGAPGDAPSHQLVVTDYLDVSVGRGFQRSGRSDLIRAVSGTGRAIVRFAPRVDFGRQPTRLKVVQDGLELVGTPEPVVLYAPGVQWKIDDEGPHQTAVAEIVLNDHEVVFELRWGTGSLRVAPLSEPDRRVQTQKFWSTWLSSLRPPFPSRPPEGSAAHFCRLSCREQIERSALLIRALCHGPSGAIAAAATTSLPEQLGGVRNWDYRYCWPRDAALAAASLVRLGNTGVALRLLDYLAAIVASLPSPERIRPIYDVMGRELGTEAEISEVAGYGLSRPVRVGNAAAGQTQLDVFGPIVDLAAMVAERGAPVTPEVWRLVEAMVQAVAARWREPDHGVWEIRAAPRHHTHSRVMCWQAVNRAITVADVALGQSRPDWAALRDEIAADVFANGWHKGLNSFVGYYQGQTLDAAALFVATTGMLPGTDERLRGTVDAINRNLRRGALVRRYVDDDGLPGIEGGMLICSFWLVEGLAIVGRLSEAADLFRDLMALAPPSGLLSEQIDLKTLQPLGNFPQAYSHLSLINAAVRLAGLGVAVSDLDPKA